MSNQIYYAFIESIEELGGELSIIFDSIHQDEHERLKSAPDLAELRTEIIHTTLDQRCLSYVYKWKHMYSNRWYRLVLSENINNGVWCDKYSSISSENVSRIALEEIHLFAPSDSITQELESTYSFDNLHNLENAIVNESEVKSLLESITPEGDFIGRVRNVGQGSCNSFLSFQGDPYLVEEFLYLALGGGFGPNKNTYPAKINFTPADNALHILCHWDMDHWVSSDYRAKELNQVQWLAPKQKNVGPTHVVKAQQLVNSNKLLFWPDTLASSETKFIKVYKLPDHKSKNYSGLVMAVQTAQNSDKYFFYSGDAPFSRCRKLIQHINIPAIAIPHHGGKMPFRDILPAPQKHVAICSYGRNNTYHHPFDHQVKGPSSTIKRYEMKNWTTWVETLSGDQYFYGGKDKSTCCILQLNFSPNISIV